MNYRSHKLIQERIKKRIRNIVLIVLAVLLAGLCVFSLFVPVESWKYHFNLPSVEVRQDGDARIHYLNAKNGSCTLVETPDGKNIIIGGGADDGVARKNILRFMNALKIKTVDALIVPDGTARGVGALRDIVRYYEVKAVYLPQKDGTNAEYLSFLSDVSKKEIPAHRAKFGDVFSENAEYDFRVLYPFEEGAGAQEITLLFRYGETDILLSAGLGKSTLETLVLEKKTQLLDKWGIALESLDFVQIDAGVDVECLEGFLTAYGNPNVIFSCLGASSYAPSDACFTMLDNLGVSAYKTYADGYITITVNGDGYSISTENT